MSPSAPKLFVSTFPYALIKTARAMGVLAGEDSSGEMRLLESEFARGAESDWACVRTVEECKHIEPAYLLKDASGALDECRSRMAGSFLSTPGPDVWLQIDDDIYAPRDTIRAVVELARKTRAVATVPYLLRDGRTGSVGGLTFVEDDVAGTVVSVRAAWTGMGLTAMHREAVDAIARRCPIAETDKGAVYPALFLRYVDEHRHWLGEDIAFSRRAEAMGVPIHVLPDAPICHAGRWTRLNLDGSFSVDRATAAGDYREAV